MPGYGTALPLLYMDGQDRLAEATSNKGFSLRETADAERRAFAPGAVFVGEGFALPFSNCLAHTVREPGGLPYETAHASHSEELKGDEEAAVPGRKKKQILRPEFGLRMAAAGVGGWRM